MQRIFVVIIFSAWVVSMGFSRVGLAQVSNQVGNNAQVVHDEGYGNDDEEYNNSEKDSGNDAAD